MVISKADNVDTVATKDAIVEAAKNPLSVIIVAVGDMESQAAKKRLEEMDGDGGEIKHSITGEVAERDIVQTI